MYSADRGPLIIGHRGAAGYRPEHTRSAYHVAIDLGVDAVEPDLVPCKDGVLVVRHESEIGSTTDVASRPEFANRRVTKVIDGDQLTGWFTEDFTWQELSTLRSHERLPHLRPDNRRHDGTEPILRFDQLLDMLEVHNASAAQPVGLVVEIKHPTYFASIGFDMAALTAQALAGRPWGSGGYPLWFESFERSVLIALAERGMTGERVYLIDDDGAAPDDIARMGVRAPTYADALTAEGLADIAEVVSGISPAWRCLISSAAGAPGKSRGVVEAAHDVGLLVFTWTLRPENHFLAEAWKSGVTPSQWGNWRAQFDAIIATGVDGVFADHPDLVRRTA